MPKNLYINGRQANMTRKAMVKSENHKEVQEDGEPLPPQVTAAKLKKGNGLEGLVQSLHDIKLPSTKTKKSNIVFNI
jgi:hypothetical protein